MKQLAEARKFLVAVAGAIAIVVEAGLLHGSALHWATVGSSIVAALLVYWTPNATSSTQSALDTFMAALHHPAIFGSIVSRLRNELPTILAEATQSTVTVAPGPAQTDGATGAIAALAPTEPAEPLPPLIPPDVPQEAAVLPAETPQDAPVADPVVATG